MKKIYLVVWVYRGFIQEPEIYNTLEEARIRKENIKQKRFNPTYDEVDVFIKVL